MKIKSLQNCWTTEPEKKWSAGEVAELSDEVAEKLLNNINFVKAEAEAKGKTNDSIHREKRGARTGV
jgi:uncharacterized protein (DUF885 family)